MLALAFSLTACGGGSGVEPPVETRDISLTPGTAVVFVGDSLRLIVAALDSRGQPIPGRAAAFQSSDPLVATVSTEGVVYGHARGSTTIEASIGGFRSTSMVTVRIGGVVDPAGGTISIPGGAVTITIPPGAVTSTTEIDIDTASVQPGETPPLRGTMFHVGPSGVILSRPATLSIRYDPVGLTPGEERSAGLYVENGITWLAVQGSAANLGNQNVAGPIMHAGSFGIFAPGPVASLAISPASATVVFGTTQQLLCELRDSAGQVLGNRPIRWSSSDTDVAQVNQNGKVTPISLGYAQITAASGGASGTSNITSAFTCNCPGLPSDVMGTAGGCFCAASPAGSR